MMRTLILDNCDFERLNEKGDDEEKGIMLTKTPAHVGC